MTPRRKTRLLWPWWLPLVALTVASCASGGGAGGMSPDQVRVRVAEVGYDQESGAHYVLLEERGGTRSLPILIGDDEARAILFELQGFRPNRPLTYELLREVIVRTGNHVDRVVIADMHDETYFAKIYLDGGRYLIDSRPSDAIALAMGVDAPIFVADKLMEAPTSPGPRKAIRSANGLGLSVQEMTPDLAQYFSVEPLSGVLVAEAGPDATKAGIEHGDIITEIEGRKIHTPEEFARQAAAASVNRNVALTLLRGGKTQVVTLPASRSAQTTGH